MKVIVEYVLLNNFIIDTIIISLSARLLSEKARFTYLSAAFGSVMAVLFPLFRLPFFAMIFVKFLIGIIMCSISFSFSTLKKVSLTFSVFMLVTFMLGGGCYLLENMLGELPIFVPLLAVIITGYMLMKLSRFFLKKKSFSAFKYGVCLTAGGIHIEEKAFLDSGNSLIDPLSKRPVVILNISVFRKLYPSIPLEKVILKNITDRDVAGAHYISINTFGNVGKILIFELECLEIKKDNEILRHSPVAAGLSLNGFGSALEGSVLLHPELI